MEETIEELLEEMKVEIGKFKERTALLNSLLKNENIRELFKENNKKKEIKELEEKSAERDRILKEMENFYNTVKNANRKEKN